jgi:AraC-like DNA-binding protein
MAKSDNSYEHHLVMKEICIRPGQDWPLQLSGWSMVLMREGVAYLRHQLRNQELARGAVLLAAQRPEGSILASQLGDASLHVFTLEPQRLTGLITLCEQRFFEAAASRCETPPQILPQQSPVALKLSELAAHPNRNSLLFRLQLLQIFFEAFGNEFKQAACEPAPQLGAKERLRRLLEQTAVSDLVEMSCSELVQRMMCTPRHLNRMFHEIVGKSFRDKQTEVRLQRATELLATTDSKVLEVALESGYQSVSLFNLIFKRHYGTTPSLWRKRIKGQRLVKRRTSKISRFN